MKHELQLPKPELSVWYVTTPDLETICKTAEDAKEFLEQYILYNYPAEADSMIECLQRNYHENKETFTTTSKDFDYVCADKGYFIFRDETVSDADDSTIEERIDKAAMALAHALLLMKFVQNIPIIGVVGGASDFIYMERISDYAVLKYQRRFLVDQMRLGRK